MHITRRKTRQITVGKLKIGGDAPGSVQSMCSTDTRDVAATVEQIRQLQVPRYFKVLRAYMLHVFARIGVGS